MPLAFRRFAALTLAALTLALPAAGHAQVRVSGVDLPERIRAGDHTLVLNGAGTRTRFVVKVYVAALYLPAPRRDAAAILALDQPARIELRLLRDIDGDTLSGALRQGLADNTDAATRARIAPQEARLDAVMKSVGQARAGDVVDLDFSQEGVSVAYKGQLRERIEGADIARALLRVWLGDKPAQASLKEALLGADR